MTVDLDLRDVPADAQRDRLAETLADGTKTAAGDGDAVAVVADRNVETDLLRYQIERGVELEREYETTGPDVWRFELTPAGPIEDGDRPSFDARQLPPQQRHSVLTAAFDELAPGEGFVLVNDHDPKPLYHELSSTRGDVVEWTYRREGGGEWAVEIGKVDAAAADASDAAADATDAAADGDDESAEDVLTRFDVREIPKAERHPTIHHRYGMIPEGGTLELIAPHEPRPLQREFRARYGDAFDWDVVEQAPGEVRVQVTKETDADGADGVGAGADANEAAHGQCEHHDHGASDSDSAEASADGDAGEGAPIEVAEELDVRDRPPAQRHQAIFEAYAELDRGEGFVLVNDHDPKPLYHQFDAEAGPEFRWEYQARDPGEFRVLIGKAPAVAGDDAAGDAADAPF